MEIHARTPLPPGTDSDLIVIGRSWYEIPARKIARCAIKRGDSSTPLVPGGLIVLPDGRVAQEWVEEGRRP